jgi:hypothetical protein
LARHIAGHQVLAAVDLGWGDLDDAPLLDAMAGRFEALVTVDRGCRENKMCGSATSASWCCARRRIVSLTFYR